MKSRVLLVDDDPALVDSLRDILEDVGYSIYVSATGAEAQAELERFAPDLMILDYNLPDGKGLDWAARFQERRPGLKILLMTGMSESDLPIRGEIVGFIPKPVAPPELLRLIREQLQ